MATTKREKVDELYRQDCTLYTNLGKDSTPEEREEVKRKSLAIYREIEKLCPKWGEILLSGFDE